MIYLCYLQSNYSGTSEPKGSSTSEAPDLLADLDSFPAVTNDANANGNFADFGSTAVSPTGTRENLSIFFL